jgi:phosphatidylglycerophosphate synthase
MNSKTLVPSGISALRIAALPLFLYFNSWGLSFLCLLVFALAAGTDLIDGYMARKLNVTSKMGAYFDAVTDFALVMGIFVAFTLNGYYNAWLLLLIAGSFAQFAITGYFGKRLYDPLGKYIGSVLYIGVALTLLSPTALVFVIVQAGVFAFTVTSFITRMLGIAGFTKKSLIAMQTRIQPPNPKTSTKKP